MQVIIVSVVLDCFVNQELTSAFMVRGLLVSGNAILTIFYAL